MSAQWSNARPTATIPSGAHIPVELASEDLGGREHAITLTPGMASLADYPETAVPEVDDVDE